MTTRKRTLRVYGWTAMRSEAPGHGQVREIVATHSWAEVQRLTGRRMVDLRHQGCETGNAEELALAVATPGVVFWKPLDHGSGGWKRA